MNLDFTTNINKGYELGLNYPKVDKLIISVHWWSLAYLAIFAFTNSILKIAEYSPSPFSWRVIPIEGAIWTIGLGFVTALIPTLLLGKFKNHYVWRLLVTGTLSMISYLAVYISGGSIEVHFVFFAMLALVVIYADWRIGWVMLVLVGLHHAILNYFAPTWVYFYGRNDLAVFSHAFFVLIAVVFTTIVSNAYRQTIQQIEGLRADLRAMNEELAKEKGGR